jgi:Signal transduction histidine kinase
LSPESLIEVFFHKLSQPIGALNIGLELAAMSNDPTRHKAAIFSGLEQVQRLNWLFGVMRTFFADDFTHGCERLSFNSVLHNAVQNCRPAADSRQVEVLAELGSNLSLTAHPHHLGHALENLLANAIRCSQPGGTVRISASCEHSTVVATIADDSHWLPEEVANIFDPFPAGVEVLPDKPNNLDLCLSRRIIQAYGGDLSARSNPGGTRVFAVTLPSACPAQQ